MSIIKPLSEDSILPWERGLVIEKSENDLPTLSVVIPIYNSGRFLEKTLRSLLCNDLSGVQVILMDGGSTDHTMDIVDHYRDMFFHVQSTSDDGQSDAINKGYKIANSEILYWLNGDDIILPNTVNSVRRYFRDNQDCQVLVGNAYMTEKDFKPINHFVYSEEKLRFEYLLDYAKNHLIQPSVFFTREAWDAVGPLDINDHYAMDADLFIGMAKQFKMYHINIDIAYSVYHEECKTRGARAESITSLALVQAKYGGLAEAKKTLGILVGLYREKENEPTNLSGEGSKVRALEAKLKEMESHLAKQKELCLQADLKENP